MSTNSFHSSYEQDDRISRRRDSPYAPSWSWVSIIGEIEFSNGMDGDGDLRDVVEVLEVSTEPVNDNPFGPLLSGSLKLKGHVSEPPDVLEWQD